MVGDVEVVGNADVEAFGDVEAVEPFRLETFSLQVSPPGSPRGLFALTIFGRFYLKGDA